MFGQRGLQLPQEVLDTILENLHPFQDTQTLRRCALTARCLLPTSQRILFRTIFVLDVSWSRRARIDQLHSLLNLSPHLAQYTKVFYLFLQSSESTFQNLLPSIIPRLQSLQKIELHTSLSSDGTYIPFTSLRVTTLLGGEEMPRIRSFKLISCSMSDTRELLGVCEWLAARDGLEDLQFNDVRVIDAASPSYTTTQSAVAPVHLHSFAITRQSQVVYSLLQWATSSTSCLQFTELKDLTVGDLAEQSSRPLFHIFDQAKSSLTCLHFEGSMSPLTSFQFDTLSQLRTISCHIPMHQPSPLKEWCVILKRSKELKLDNFIAQLKPVYQGFELNESMDQFLDHPWKEFEELLINNTGCRLLVLQIIISHDRMETDLLRKCFPLLHRDGGGKLLVKQKVSKFGEMELNWEYTSDSGQWRRSDNGSIFETCAHSI
ncbi:hypothetical protein VNI00_004235 [Paramarasmius palmivorus]|uniref:F-box domain-containing protein n=1 Tax=Paramarasmius palmivorus TaxID=297713 RepID=A0AAW0DQ18_9AGAR